MAERSTKLDIRALWNFDEPEESEKKFDALFDEQREIASNDLKAEILTQKARAQGLQRHFDDARDTLSRARELLDGSPTSGNAAYFLEIGRVENSSGHKDTARPHFLRALELAEAAKEENLAVDAAHMMAIVETGTAALSWNERAIAMAEAASEPRARNWLGSLYNNLGWTYHDMGEYEKALDLFDRALKFREEKGNRSSILIARYCVAKCKRSMGAVEEALRMQLDIEREHASLGNEPGFCFEEIAECLLALGRDDEAVPYFSRAFEVLSKDEWLMDTEPERVRRLGLMAGLRRSDG